MASPETKVTTTVASEAIPSDIQNGVFLGNPVLDNVVSCVMAMGAELWATKRRMKVLEALLSAKGVSNADIEGFTPSAEQTAAWEKDRDRFIDLTLGSLANDRFSGMGADFPKRF